MGVPCNDKLPLVQLQSADVSRVLHVHAPTFFGGRPGPRFKLPGVERPLVSATGVPPFLALAICMDTLGKVLFYKLKTVHATLQL